MNIEIDGQPVEKFGVSEASDGSRLVTIHLPSNRKSELESAVNFAACVLRERGDGKLSIIAEAKLHRALHRSQGLPGWKNEIDSKKAKTPADRPDPIKIARCLLDTLTEGALSSLICFIRDEVIPMRRSAPLLDDIKRNLRALGEKIGD